MRDGEVRDLAAAGRGKANAVGAVRAGARRLGGDHHGAVLGAVYGKLRFPAHHFQRLALGIEHQRMAGQRMQAGHAEVAVLAVPFLARGGRGDGGFVLRQEEVHACGFGRQALGAVLLAAGPAAARAPALLPSVQRNVAAAGLHGPCQTPVRFASTVSFAIRRRVRQFLDQGEGLLPWAWRHRQRGERRGAERGVAGGVAVRRCIVVGRQAGEHGATLGRHPGETVFVRPGAKLANRRQCRFLRGLIQPAARDAFEQRRQAIRPPRPAEGHPGLGLHAGRPLGEGQARTPWLIPSPRLGNVLEQLLRCWRVQPRQRQQGQREGPRFRVHQALAFALQDVEGLLNVEYRSFVLAAQHGHQGARRRPADLGGRGLAQRFRQVVEHRGGGGEVPLQHANDGHIAGVQERAVRKRLAGVDHRVRGGAVANDMAETGLAGLFAQGQRHRPQRLLRERLGQQFEAGVAVPLGGLESLRVAGQQVAALQDPARALVAVGGIVIASRLRLPLALQEAGQGGEECLECAVRSGFAQQRQSGCRRHRYRAVCRSLRHAKLHEIGNRLFHRPGRWRRQRQRRLLEQALQPRDSERIRHEQGAELRHRAAVGRQRREILKARHRVPLLLRRRLPRASAAP